MPIYEFYCVDCHTVFSFLSTRVDTQTRPACPRCQRPGLERQASRFAISRNRPESEADADGLPDFDESRMEGLMRSLEREVGDNFDENDPRQAARLMRRLYDAAGMELTGPMAEAMSRMEAGEDPEAIEAELGDALETVDPLAAVAGKTRPRLRFRPPARDETLYDL